jgi:hypothetical protein
MFSKRGLYQINRTLLTEKAIQIDADINRMISIRDGLLHAANCSSATHSECPKFQKLIRVAGKERLRKKRINHDKA